jgi:methylmalonyl-CoA mutase N-terminal domain/subunit
LAIAKTLLSACSEAQLAVDRFADKISYQFSQGSYFFEDIAKIRAARRIWATLLKEEFGAQNDRICRMKIHMQTAGSSLTAQEPLNNIVRIALQVLSAAMSGTQSMHVASYDEALGIPTEEAVRLAIQTSKIVMHETGVTDVADPLGGSYYVEALTNEIEKRSLELLKRIDDFGGAIKAIEDGFFEQEIADSNYAYHHDVSRGKRVIVGLNRYQENQTRLAYKVFRPNPEASAIAIARLKKLRKDRDQRKAQRCIRQIQDAAQNRQALMPIYIEAAKANVTLGEMIQAVEEVLGRFQYAPIIANPG